MTVKLDKAKVKHSVASKDDVRIWWLEELEGELLEFARYCVRKADNLKALAGKCYLSVPSVYRSTIASLYSNANKMYNNGVKFIKMKQTDTAINMLRSANMQYENMIRVGRQVGGRSC